ncbi:MAG: glycine cleavage system protein GcvH [Actinobacteria bacterium]|nr:glycine cleavage system protein GcvH [Actinomycetota bacterium]
MAEIPAHLKYTSEHEWVESLGGDRVRVGITDFAQQALGDIVYVLTPKIGEIVRAGAVCGEVESTKSVSEIYAPLDGTISAINDGVVANPETINAAPYGDGWLFEISSVSPEHLAALFDQAGYAAFTQSA